MGQARSPILGFNAFFLTHLCIVQQAVWRTGSTGTIAHDPDARMELILESKAAFDM